MIGRRKGVLPKVPLGAAPDAGLRRFMTLAPGEAAPLLPFDLPAGVTGPARIRIARRQLVDRLGQIGARLELHPLGTGAWTRAVVVAPETASAWRADPLVRDRRCSGLAPDYLALPAADGLVVVDTEKGRLRVRLGLGDGFSAPAAVAAPMLRGALGGAALRAALVLPGNGTGPARAIIEAAGLPVASSLDALPALGVEVAGAAAAMPDLRVGPGQSANQLARELALWAVPVALGLVAAGLWSVATIRETRALRAEVEAVEAATVEQLRQGLVPSGPILDIRAQVAQARATASTPGAAPDPIALLRRAAAALAGHGAEIRSITLEPPDGLSVTLRASDFEAVEALTKALRDAGLAAETATARAADTGVEARIALSDGAG